MSIRFTEDELELMDEVNTLRSNLNSCKRLLNQASEALKGTPLALEIIEKLKEIEND